MAVTAGWMRHGVRALLAGVAVYYALLAGEYSAFDLRRLERMQQQERVALAASQLRVDSLRVRATSLQDDPAAIERLARERFGLIRSGEVLYRFIEVDSAFAASIHVASSP